MEILQQKSLKQVNRTWSVRSKPTHRRHLWELA